MNTLTLSLILPCYNEGKLFTENVHTILSTLFRSKNTFEVIFVDDGSSDGTQKNIQKICTAVRNCHAIYHPVNQGRGAAVIDGIKFARGQVVGFIDIDCEVSPVYIPEIVDMIVKNHTDMVIGKRIYRTTFSSLLREILSSGYRWLAQRIINTHGFDTESGYKFFSRKKILRIVPQLHEKGWFWDTEVTVQAIRHGFRIREIPVLFLRRFDKHSSVRIIPDTLDYLTHLVSFAGRRS